MASGLSNKVYTRDGKLQGKYCTLLEHNIGVLENGAKHEYSGKVHTQTHMHVHLYTNTLQTHTHACAHTFTHTHTHTQIMLRFITLYRESTVMQMYRMKSALTCYK